MLLFLLTGCVCGRTEDRTYSAGGELTLRYVSSEPWARMAAFFEKN